MSKTKLPLAKGTESHPFRFEATAATPSLRDYLKTGEVTLRGVAYAAPLADRAALEGTLQIQPFRARRLAYQFSFPADDGRRCHFVGEKTIRWTDPVASFTTLTGEISDEHGKLLATATLRFDPRRILGFVRGLRWH